MQLEIYRGIYISSSSPCADSIDSFNTFALSAEAVEDHPPNKCPGYDTKQSDDEAAVMLELWGMLSTHSLTSLRGPLWSGVVAPDRVLSMGQIELDCVLTLNWIVWNRTVWHLTVCKQKTIPILNWIVWNLIWC